MGAFISFKNVSYSYHSKSQETPVLNNISFDVNKGEFLSIVGPSGCGKSTILSIIAGLLIPEEGSVCLTNNKIGYMLQKDHLFEWRTVFNNTMLGLEIRKEKTGENIKYVNDMMIKYGIMPFKNARPSELSGGLRQRAALIRTLALKPEILLLDEPFSALDYQTRIAVGSDIGQIISDEGKTAILVTHDLAEAITIGRRILVLSQRPSHILYNMKLEFDDSITPLQKRSTSLFQEYFKTIWEVINNG